MTGYEESPEAGLTGVNWLTRVNQVSKCVRKVGRSYTVGFKIPEPLREAYAELPSASKTLIKTVVMSLIYALAKKHGVEIECEEQLRPMISDAPAVGGQIIINANINENRNENKVRVALNVDVEALRDALRLLEYLYGEAARGMPPQNRAVLARRLARAKETLAGLIASLN